MAGPLVVERILGAIVKCIINFDVDGDVNGNSNFSVKVRVTYLVR
jgi:hypothetical protein